MQIAEITESFRSQINHIIKEEWAGPLVVSKGKTIDTTLLNGYSAIDSETEEMAGFLLYKIDGDVCEIAVLKSIIENKGAGTALINKAIYKAKNEACKKVFLVTTNDNTHAIRFYQKRGFELAAVHFNAMDKTRQIKPGIPLQGIDGIPLKHEIEFEIEWYSESSFNRSL